MVTRVLDCRCTPADGSPLAVSATRRRVSWRFCDAPSPVRMETGVAGARAGDVCGGARPAVRDRGRGPVLVAIGGDVVGMSTAVELQTAIDEGLETACSR